MFLLTRWKRVPLRKIFQCFAYCKSRDARLPTHEETHIVEEFKMRNQELILNMTDQSLQSAFRMTPNDCQEESNSTVPIPIRLKPLFQRMFYFVGIRNGSSIDTIDFCHVDFNVAGKFVDVTDHQIKNYWLTDVISNICPQHRFRVNSVWGLSCRCNLGLNKTGSFKSYDFQKQKWIDSVNNNEISPEYWEHYNDTYISPNYPIVEKQLAFLFYDGKSKGLAHDRFEVLGNFIFWSK